MEIRESVPGDLPAIESLYPAAFPDEDLIPLVHDLLQDTSVSLSLVATINSQLAGHVVFTMGSVQGCDLKAALLGPLAVAPARQRQGIGSALVREGLRWMKELGVDQVYVLGDPAYYGRLGFEAELSVEPPLAIPDEWRLAWQSLSPGGGSVSGSGRLMLPEQWMRPELWSE